MTARAPILPRAFAVLAALCLVGAFALIVLYPPYMSLNRLIGMFDPGFMLQVVDLLHGLDADWAWQSVVHPLVMRPAWLFPFSLGLVLIGLALTVRPRRHAPGSPRWRN